MTYKHEPFINVISHLYNWLRGGSIKELYCSRIVRENDVDSVIRWNWFFFCWKGEIGHCQRVYEKYKQ